MNWRVVSSGPQPTLTLSRAAHTAVGDAQKGIRPVWFPDTKGFIDTRVYDRYALHAATSIDGPAVIEERESTLIVPPGAQCVVAPDGSLAMRLTP